MQVNNPAHYNKQFIEAIDIITLFVPNNTFCLGNYIKYILRAPYKNNFKEDIRKAFWYLDHINYENKIHDFVLSDFEQTMLKKYITNLEAGNTYEEKCGRALMLCIKYLDKFTYTKFNFERFFELSQQIFMEELLEEKELEEYKLAKGEIK